MPSISIIVPVYNVEAYLSQCLDSLRSQSFSDIEIICVNDGSLDRSQDILDLFVELDQRIKIVRKENGGLSSARNVGIDVAQGKYIMFVDSDDTVVKDACKEVFQAFESNAADIVTFGAHCYPEFFGNDWLTECLSPEDKIYDTFDIDVLLKESAQPYVWRTAFSLDFVNRTSLRFREDILFGEDAIFHFMAYPRAAKTVLVSSKLYNYRVSREDSLMMTRSKSVATKVKDHLQIAACILEDWKEQQWLDQYREEMLDWLYEFVANDVFYREEVPKKEALKSLANLLQTYFDDVQFLSISSKKQLLTQKIIDRSFLSDAELAALTKLYRKAQEVNDGILKRIRSWPSRLFAKAPFQMIYRGLRHILPAPARSIEEQLKEIAYNVKDTQKTSDSMMMLLAEYENKKSERQK